MLTLTDKRDPQPVVGNPSVIASYKADVVSAADYSPFGMTLPGRVTNNHWQKYRYGFNGKESDSEVNGPYNELDYGMRVYEPRLGRFFSVDPLTSKYPWYTPFQFAGNTPIWATDLDGLEPKPTNDGNSEAEKQTTSADIPSTKGPFIEKATKTWYWHKGSQDYGTKSGWYEEKEYRQMTWPIAADLAGYSDMYSTVATHDNWSDERKQAVANSRLGQFFSSGVSEESVKTLLANAYSVARNRNAISFGRTEFSDINVESVIGAGQIVKELTKGFLTKAPRIINNSRGVPYPQIAVEGYGEVPFPRGPFSPNNSEVLRREFTPKLKADFKDWWIAQGRPWPEVPEGSILNIHHIKPLSRGGTNDFENLIPLIQPQQHQPFTNWWRGF